MRLGDDVEVLGGEQRHGDAGASRRTARAHWPAQLTTISQRDLAFAVAAAPAHAGDRAAVDDHADRRARPRRCARRACARPWRATASGRSDWPCRRRESTPRRTGRRCAAAGRSRRPAPGEMNSKSMPKLLARAICRLSSISRSGVLRDVEAAALLPAGRQSGLRLERRIELDAVAAHARRVARRAHLADQAGRVPGRAAGELALLEQHDVACRRAWRGGRRCWRRRCRRRRRRPARARAACLQERAPSPTSSLSRASAPRCRRRRLPRRRCAASRILP